VVGLALLLGLMGTFDLSGLALPLRNTVNSTMRRSGVSQYVMRTALPSRMKRNSRSLVPGLVDRLPHQA
jgi:hypothetical protein